MSYAENPYASWGMTAADAPASERAGFIRQTYLHLGGAVLAFVALEAALLQIPGIGDLVMQISASRWGWFVVLGAFIAVSYVANNWALNSASLGKQYLGLGLYVVAEAVIFVPLLWIAQHFGGENVIPTAGLLTVLVFSGLTAIVFLTGADFSFLRTGLMVAGLIALVMIFASAIFGFNLGIIFIGAMLALASGYILYDTSNVLHHYRIGQHVAASLALFASVALLFWYMVQLVMSLTGRD
ncbi:MAG: Bax inhibitor-1 family protein [Pirellulales bacterium]